MKTLHEEIIGLYKAIEWREKDYIPIGYYVSGRSNYHRKDDYGIWQSTNDWNVAEQYAGNDGYIALYTPKNNANIIDLRDYNKRKKIIDKLVDDYENNKLDSELEDLISYVLDEGNIEDLIDELYPDDIVSSAEFYDNPELVDWFDRVFGYDLVTFGKEAAVLFNHDEMDILNIDANLLNSRK